MGWGRASWVVILGASRRENPVFAVNCRLPAICGGIPYMSIVTYSYKSASYEISESYPLICMITSLPQPQPEEVPGAACCLRVLHLACAPAWPSGRALGFDCRPPRGRQEMACTALAAPPAAGRRRGWCRPVHDRQDASCGVAGVALESSSGRTCGIVGIWRRGEHLHAALDA